MNKKGFTLIELLAVIVILAVIALISTPLIMNVIANSRKNADRESARSYIKTIETKLTESMMEYPNLIIGAGITDASGDATRAWPCTQCNETEDTEGSIDIEFTGTAPKVATLSYDSSTGRISGKLAYTNGCWTVNPKGELVPLKDTEFYHTCK